MMIAGALFWLCVLAVFYTYAGYPALLALLARLRPRPYWPVSETPDITLLITAYNEQAAIAGKLENSLALDYPHERLHILVAADGSDDRTAEIVRAYAGRGVELCYQPERRGKMAAINRALPQARGEIVVFSDANNMYASDALRHLAAPFTDPKVGMVSGAKHIERDGSSLGESEGLYWKYESFIKQQETRLGSCAGVAGEILALRRALYQAPPDNIINDDFYLALDVARRGWRVVYAPQARSSESVSASAQDEITRRARIIAGRYQALSLAPQLLPWRQPLLVWQILSHKFLRPLAPLAMLGALAAALAALAWPPVAAPAWLTLAPPFGALSVGMQALFYLAAALGNRLGQRGRLGRLLYAPTFLVNSNLAALIGLARFLARRQTTLWQRVRRAGE